MSCFARLDAGRLFIAVSVLGCWPVSAASHADEIQAYVAIRAMAATATARCADILASDSMVEQARGFFHIADSDADAYRTAETIEMKRLAVTIEAAPSLKAWCDDAYRHYAGGGHGPRPAGALSYGKILARLTYPAGVVSDRKIRRPTTLLTDTEIEASRNCIRAASAAHGTNELP